MPRQASERAKETNGLLRTTLSSKHGDRIIYLATKQKSESFNTRFIARRAARRVARLCSNAPRTESANATQSFSCLVPQQAGIRRSPLVTCPVATERRSLMRKCSCVCGSRHRSLAPCSTNLSVARDDPLCCSQPQSQMQHQDEHLEDIRRSVSRVGRHQVRDWAVLVRVWISSDTSRWIGGPEPQYMSMLT